MSKSQPWRRWKVFAAVVVTGAIGIAYLATGASATREDTTTLRVSLFGDFGYHDLYAQYMRSHPNVEIKEEIQEYRDHHTQLAQRLATGAGAADIEAVEVGFIAQFTATPTKFVDLRQYGATALKGRWLPWKYQQAVARSRPGHRPRHGRRQPRHLLPEGPVREGGPARPTATRCRRSGRRGRATSRPARSTRPRRRRACSSSTPAATSTTRWSRQISPGVLRHEGQAIALTNPRVKAAWTTVIGDLAAARTPASRPSRTNWNSGFKNGKFATVTCPAWMMGYIQGQAPDDGGQVGHRGRPGRRRQLGRLVPRRPEQSKNQAAAADLVKFLTSPASQMLRLQADRQPAEPAGAAEEQGRAGIQEPLLQQRPGGQDLRHLGAEAEAADPRPAPGRHPEPRLRRPRSASSRGKQTPAESWKQFLKDVKRLPGKRVDDPGPGPAVAGLRPPAAP